MTLDVPAVLLPLAGDLYAAAEELAAAGAWPPEMLPGVSALLSLSAGEDLLPDPEAPGAPGAYLSIVAAQAARITPESPPPLWPEYLSVIGDAAISARQADVAQARSAWAKGWRALKEAVAKAATEASRAADEVADDLDVPRPRDLARYLRTGLPAGAGLYAGAVLPPPLGPMAALAGIVYGAWQWSRR